MCTSQSYLTPAQLLLIDEIIKAIKQKWSSGLVDNYMHSLDDNILQKLVDDIESNDSEESLAISI